MNLQALQNKPFQYVEHIVNIQENTTKKRPNSWVSYDPDYWIQLDDMEEQKNNGKYEWEDDDEGQQKVGCLCRYCKYCEKRAAKNSKYEF